MGEFVMELWAFMKERKKFWLLPIIIVLLLLGTLIVLTQGSAVAPFIYTLFRRFLTHIEFRSAPCRMTHECIECRWAPAGYGEPAYCLSYPELSRLKESK